MSHLINGSFPPQPRTIDHYSILIHPCTQFPGCSHYWVGWTLLWVWVCRHALQNHCLEVEVEPRGCEVNPPHSKGGNELWEAKGFLNRKSSLMRIPMGVHIQHWNPTEELWEGNEVWSEGALRSIDLLPVNSLINSQIQEKITWYLGLRVRPSRSPRCYCYCCPSPWQPGPSLI